MKFLIRLNKKNRNLIIIALLILLIPIVSYSFFSKHENKPNINEENNISETVPTEEAVDCFNNQADNNNIEVKNNIDESMCIALTFDDGPSAFTPKLLDGLKQRNAKATFFVLGNKVQNNADLIQRINNEGHEIGNHTVNHQHLNTATPEEIRTQLTQTNDWVQSITGVRPTAIRPPAGDYDQRLLAYGMRIILWSVDPLDWKTQNKQASVDHIVANVKPGDIILLHDTHEASVDAGLEVIDILQKKGFNFVTVDKLLGPDAPVGAVYSKSK